MECRAGCGACCIAPSITSSLPARPEGKPAGEPCPHLDAALRCELFGRPERPDVCSQFAAERSICGDSRDEALVNIEALEQATQ